MGPAEFAAWRTAVEGAVRSVLGGFEQKFGFPPGDNFVGSPDAAATERLAELGDPIPGDLLQMYKNIGAVTLPDIDNGIFVHPAGLVADAYEAHQLRSITGRHHAEVILFGSDGGGTLYALASPSGSPVYRLPPDGVFGGVYHSDNSGFDVIASDLAGFLARVREAVELFAATGEISKL